MKTPEEIKVQLKKIPNRPGVYRFYDKNDEVIYVGKAKKLKNRVSSYFNKNKYENRKTKALVSKIKKIKFLEVATEQDALLLENTLIKKYFPRYNIALKDNKTFPWICIKKEPFPRVFSTRKTGNKTDEFYGPYASIGLMRNLIELINKSYKLRTCNLALSKSNIENKKFKVCLEYHIKNCYGPCEGHQSREDYDKVIREIRLILKGKLKGVLEILEKEMNEHAEKLEFEAAQLTKEKIARLKKYQGKSSVVSVKDFDADVFSILSDPIEVKVKKSYVHYMKVVDGAMVNGYTTELRSRLDETDSEILAFAIMDIRSRIKEPSKTILTNMEVNIDPNSFLQADEENSAKPIEVFTPKRGDKKALTDLAERNAKYYMYDKKKQEKVVNPQAHYMRILEQTKKDLRLTEVPVHIECFDNSNFQGTNAVAACVVFKNGKPSSKDYRHFNIKTVVGPDDFASMEEVVFRRYKRLLDEEQSLPQLIVIDGGKGQLSSAVKSLEKLGLRGKIGIIGIAKRLEEIYFPNDSIPLYIDKRSESLKLIQHLRNEAHRFGITHHRNKRSKNAFGSELDNISGIGKGTVEKLLTQFGSVKNVKEATEEQLSKYIGPAKAALVFDYFKDK